MKRYSCIVCDDYTDECTAFVPNKTPEDFDKDIMNVFCNRITSKQPLWFREHYDEY